MENTFKYIFIKSYSYIFKIVPLLFYMFLFDINNLTYAYWLSYSFITFINLMILSEIFLSFIYLIKEEDTRVRVKDIKECNNVINFPNSESEINFGIILVGYLPNEYEILPLTVKHIINNIVCDSYNLVLTLIYNGTDKISNEVHEKFRQEILKYKNINSKIDIILQENKTSKSKAENINFGIDILKTYGVDYIGILDSDHWIHPFALEIIKKRFEKPDKPDIIQGRCTIRKDKSLLNKLVGVDFDQIYVIGHLGGYLGRGYGIFGGSNGYFKLNVIDDLRFNKDMLTEDIDLTFRALYKGYKIVYCRDCISTEEAPPSWKAFYKQRNRWSEGWFQVSLKHTIPCCFHLKSKMSFKQRLSTFIFLPMRELFQYFSFHTYLAAYSYLIRIYLISNTIETTDAKLTLLVIINMIVPYILFYSALIQGLTGHPGWIKIFHPILCIYYDMCKTSIAMEAHARYIVGIKNWEITPRKKIESGITLKEIVI